MGCDYAVSGEFQGEFSQTIANEMVAAADENGIYGEAFDIYEDGQVNIWGQMGYGNACAIDDFLKEQALKYGLTGRFVSKCDSDDSDFYVGTPQQQRDCELGYLNSQIEWMQKRMNELNAMQF